MSDDYYRTLFSKNLKHYMNVNDITQAELINKLHINKSSISAWCNGTRLPRMDKIEQLADYFHISKADLLEDKQEHKQKQPLQQSTEIKNKIPGTISLDITLENFKKYPDYFQRAYEDMVIYFAETLREGTIDLATGKKLDKIEFQKKLRNLTIEEKIELMKGAYEEIEINPILGTLELFPKLPPQ